MKFFNTGKTYDADEIGVLKMDLNPKKELGSGDVGYIISGVKKVKRDFAELDVSLKYVNEESAIREIQRESKPGLRKYVSYKDIKPYKGGLGIRILSTSKGLRTDKQAIKDQLGGEIICRVF